MYARQKGTSVYYNKPTRRLQPYNIIYTVCSNIIIIICRRYTSSSSSFTQRRTRVGRLLKDDVKFPGCTCTYHTYIRYAVHVCAGPLPQRVSFGRMKKREKRVCVRKREWVSKRRRQRYMRVYGGEEEFKRRLSRRLRSRIYYNNNVIKLPGPERERNKSRNGRGENEGGSVRVCVLLSGTIRDAKRGCRAATGRELSRAV